MDPQPQPKSPEQLALIEKETAMRDIKERIDRSFGDPRTRELVLADFRYTFEKVGLSDELIPQLLQQLEEKLRSRAPLAEIETEVFALITTLRVGGRPFVDVLHEKLADRATLLFNQVYPELQEIKGRVIDYGAGDFQVTKKLYDVGIAIDGADIRSYRSPGTEGPGEVRILPGSRLEEIPDKSVEAAVLTNVLHHEKDNERIIEELTRVVSKRLVIMETVPLENDEPMDRQKDQVFMNDYLYNRVFHSADVPVPGTFETPKDWIDRFKRHGWVLTKGKDFGFDQPTIKDRHYLLVFERAEQQEAA